MNTTKSLSDAEPVVASNKTSNVNASKTTMPFRDLNLEDEPVSKKEKEIKPEPKKEVEKEIVYVERDRRGNGCRPGCGCRSIGCGGCLLIVLLIVGFSYLIISKPDSLWKRFVSFLNNDIQVQEFNNLSYEDATAQLNNQIDTIGDNQIVITEDQLTAIGRKNIPQLNHLTIDTKPNKIRVLWQLDKTTENEPLWGIIEISKTETNDLEISKIGTNRVGLPSFVNRAITDLALNVLDFGSEDRDADQIFNQLVDFNEDYQIKSIDIKDNQVVVNLEIKASLF